MQFSISSHTPAQTQLQLIRLLFLGLSERANVPATNSKSSSVMTRVRNELKTSLKKWLKLHVNPYIAIARVIVPNALIFLSIMLTAVVFGPELYYRFAPISTVEVKAPDTGTPLGGDFNTGTWFRSVIANSTQFISDASSGQGTQNGQAAQTEIIEEKPLQLQQTRYLPPQDKTLPEGDWLSIPSIGVRTQLLQTANPEEALMEGVWKVPEYGEPGQLDMPIILAAHRFGWDWWWQSEYWRYNSFYLLPETQPGDSIEIISDQRKWVYEIYAGAEGSEITDYNADMILYTCKFLTSPVRHFRYARLIDVDADTQR